MHDNLTTFSHMIPNSDGTTDKVYNLETETI